MSEFNKEIKIRDGIVVDLPVVGQRVCGSYWGNPYGQGGAWICIGGDEWLPVEYAGEKLVELDGAYGLHSEYSAALIGDDYHTEEDYEARMKPYGEAIALLLSRFVGDFRMNYRYEIQTRFGGEFPCWENVTCDDGILQDFDSLTAAQDEFRDHVESMEEAVSRGDVEDFDRDDWRIVVIMPDGVVEVCPTGLPAPDGGGDGDVAPEPSEDTFFAHGAHGTVEYDALGRVKGHTCDCGASCECGGEGYGTLQRVDVCEWLIYWGKSTLEDTDILDLGGWWESGKYDAPQDDWRKEIRAARTA